MYILDPEAIMRQTHGTTLIKKTTTWHLIGATNILVLVQANLALMTRCFPPPPMSGPTRPTGRLLAT